MSVYINTHSYGIYKYIPHSQPLHKQLLQETQPPAISQDSALLLLRRMSPPKTSLLSLLLCQASLPFVVSQVVQECGIKMSYSLPSLKSSPLSPGRCGSVDWVPACKPKGLRFDSQPGHMPGLRAWSPLKGSHERQPHIDVSLPLFLSPFLPLSLKVNKIFF